MVYQTLLGTLRVLVWLVKLVAHFIVVKFDFLFAKQIPMIMVVMARES
jgi:hypothetical protein